MVLTMEIKRQSQLALPFYHEVEEGCPVDVKSFKNEIGDGLRHDGPVRVIHKGLGGRVRPVGIHEPEPDEPRVFPEDVRAAVSIEISRSRHDPVAYGQQQFLG